MDIAVSKLLTPVMMVWTRPGYRGWIIEDIVQVFGEVVGQEAQNRKNISTSDRTTRFREPALAPIDMDAKSASV